MVRDSDPLAIMICLPIAGPDGVMAGIVSWINSSWAPLFAATKSERISVTSVRDPSPGKMAKWTAYHKFIVATSSPSVAILMLIPSGAYWEIGLSEEAPKPKGRTSIAGRLSSPAGVSLSGSSV